MKRRPSSHRLDLVEKRTGKCDRIARERAIAVGTKLGKNQMPTCVIVIEIERKRKAAMGS